MYLLRFAVYDDIVLSALAFYRNYGIITSDLKSAEADFAVQKHGSDCR